MTKYKVVLSPSEQSELEAITSQGKHSARKMKRAQILLMSHTQIYRDEDIIGLLRLANLRYIVQGATLLSLDYQRPFMMIHVVANHVN